MAGKDRSAEEVVDTIRHLRDVAVAVGRRILTQADWKRADPESFRAAEQRGLALRVSHFFPISRTGKLSHISEAEFDELLRTGAHPHSRNRATKTKGVLPDPDLAKPRRPSREPRTTGLSQEQIAADMDRARREILPALLADSLGYPTDPELRITHIIGVVRRLMAKTGSPMESVTDWAASGDP